MLYSELQCSEAIHKAVERMGFAEMTEIQEKTIPVMLAGRDVIAKAPTGTGKTCAFGIPVAEHIDPEKKYPQAVIMAPTRELAQQIAEELTELTYFMPEVQVACVYGGANMEKQAKRLAEGCQIVVATPGRLMDHYKHRTIDISHVTQIVLDEADEMLNMGFSESINSIFENVPEDRNTLLFSATMSKDIEKIALNYLHDHKEIVVGSRNEGAEHVNHIYYLVNAKDKYLALKRVVDFYPRIFAIIFCRTKLETQDIADKLIKDGYNAEALHGDLSQQQRDLTMQKFRNHTVQFLVATDVAARGLDVDDLTHVINYGLPDDVASYTHRSGRTGRAGKKGTSISIIHTREKFKVRQIEKQIGKEFVDGVLPTPEEICKKQLFKTMDDIMKTDVDEDQIEPYMAEINRQFEYIDKEDIIKKMVTITFGKFLDYYKNAPEIIKPETGKGSRGGEGRGSRGEGRGKVSNGRRKHETEAGFKRLFINLGKADGFYPGEIMQYLNKHVKGRQEVGHIDLLSKFAYIEVPEEDAKRVMKALNGTEYKGRTVRCNDADEEGHGRAARGGRSSEGRGGRGSERGGRSSEGRGRRGSSDDARDSRDSRGKGGRGNRGESRGGRKSRPQEDTGDWRQFFQNNDNVKFKGEEPNFEEEGWARRRPKKK